MTSSAVSAAVRTITVVCQSGRFDHVRLSSALATLEDAHDDEVDAAILHLGRAVVSGVFGPRPNADILERCVVLLAREPNRAALELYRSAVTTYLPTPRGDAASTLRGRALIAIHELEPREALFTAVTLLADEGRALSGEPAQSALAVLGAASNDAALLLACQTVLAGEIPLLVTALERMTADVPAPSFWRVAGPLIGDRFSDAVLAITDIIVSGRRTELLPGLARTLTEVGDANLMRAVLLSLVAARLDGVEAVFAAVTANAPKRALQGVVDALEMARIPGRDELRSRVQDRYREP